MRYLVLLIASVSFGISHASDPAIFEGTFVLAFEVQRFTPDNGNGAWRLNGKIPCVREYVQSLDPNAEFDPAYFHLKIRGTLSDEGHFGHLNGYSHELAVETVLECRRIPKQPPENY